MEIGAGAIVLDFGPCSDRLQSFAGIVAIQCKRIMRTQLRVIVVIEHAGFLADFCLPLARIRYASISLATVKIPSRVFLLPLSVLLVLHASVR